MFEKCLLFFLKFKLNLFRISPLRIDSVAHIHDKPHAARDIFGTLPYFGKRKQVTYHLNLSYWYFHIVPNVLFFQAKVYA